MGLLHFSHATKHRIFGHSWNISVKQSLKVPSKPSATLTLHPTYHEPIEIMGTHSRRLHISDSEQMCGHSPITKKTPKWRIGGNPWHHHSPQIPRKCYDFHWFFGSFSFLHVYSPFSLFYVDCFMLTDAAPWWLCSSTYSIVFINYTQLVGSLTTTSQPRSV